MVNQLLTGKLYHAMVELTTSCNLHCSYCAVSNPDWKINNLSNYGTIVDIIKELKQLRCQNVILHGHGETTFVKDWHKIANYLIEENFKLSICTNLIKEYSNDEYTTLSKFGSITVSIDSANEAIFKELRGGNLKQLLYNLCRIQAKNANIHWIWSSVVCDKSIDGLFDLIKAGHFLGIKTFCFCNLTKEVHLEQLGIKLRHLSELPKIEMIKSLSILNEIMGYCTKYNLELDIKAGLLDTVNSKLK